jgi:hypothetical protein
MFHRVQSLPQDTKEQTLLPISCRSLTGFQGSNRLVESRAHLSKPVSLATSLHQR